MDLLLPSPEPHRERLFRRALQLTKDRDRAEDLVGEAMLRYLRCTTFDASKGNQCGFLLKILERVWFDALSAEACELETAPIEGRRGQGGGDLLELLADVAATKPFRAIEGDRLRVVTAAVFSALPAMYRVPIALASELSYAQIAVRLGLKIGTVRARIHRGRALFRTRLESALPRMEGYADLTCEEILAAVRSVLGQKRSQRRLPNSLSLALPLAA